MRGLSPVVASGGHSSSRCAGLSIVAPPVAEHRLRNCGPRTQPLPGMRDPPRPGPEPVSAAPAGRLPTTAPPGKPKTHFKKGDYRGFPGGALFKNPPADAGDTGSSPAPGRSHMPRNN